MYQRLQDHRTEQHLTFRRNRERDQENPPDLDNDRAAQTTADMTTWSSGQFRFENPPLGEGMYGSVYRELSGTGNIVYATKVLKRPVPKNTETRVPMETLAQTLNHVSGFILVLDIWPPLKHIARKTSSRCIMSF